MNAIVDIIVPVFGMVLVGWAIGRTRLLSPEGLRGLVNVTFYALFPALLFRSMAKVRLDALDLEIVLAFFGAGLLLYFLLMPFGRAIGMRRLGDRTIFALAGTFSNGVGIGIPFVSYAFGEAGLVPLLMIISIHSLVMLTLSSFLLEIAAQGGARRRLLGKLAAAMLRMLKHPVIPPIFPGLIWSELTAAVPGLAMPAVIDRTLQALATAAPACGLIMAGASLAHVGLKEHWQTAAITAVFKLAVLPLMVWLAGRYLFTLDPLWLTVATLNAALPAGANVYMVAQLYRTGVGLATNAVVLSTAASVFTLSAVLYCSGCRRAERSLRLERQRHLGDTGGEIVAGILHHARSDHADLPVAAAIEPVAACLRTHRHGALLADIVAAERIRAFVGTERIDAPHAVHGPGVADVDAVFPVLSVVLCRGAVLVQEEAIQFFGRAQDIARAAAHMAGQRADIDPGTRVLLVDLLGGRLLASAGRMARVAATAADRHLFICISLPEHYGTTDQRIAAHNSDRPDTIITTSSRRWKVATLSRSTIRRAV